MTVKRIIQVIQVSVQTRAVLGKQQCLVILFLLWKQSVRIIGRIDKLGDGWSWFLRASSFPFYGLFIFPDAFTFFVPQALLTLCLALPCLGSVCMPILFSFQVKAAIVFNAQISVTYLETDPQNQFTLYINHNLVQRKNCVFELGPLLYSCAALDKSIRSINCWFLYQFLDDTYLWAKRSMFS